MRAWMLYIDAICSMAALMESDKMLLSSDFRRSLCVLGDVSPSAYVGNLGHVNVAGS